MYNRGFTLIELLVVIAIIGLLSSIVLTSLNTARTKAKIARAQIDISQINTAMQLYFGEKNDLPPPRPPGDLCSLCYNPCHHDTWNYIVDRMIDAGVLTAPIYNDPWGNAYCYDDNYREIACPFHSYMYSSGPNGVNELGGGDDVGFTEILPGSSYDCQRCITNPETPGCS